MAQFYGFRSGVKFLLEERLYDELSNWNILPESFFKKGKESLGIKLGELAVKLEPSNPYPVVKLSKLYRQQGNLKKAVDTFRNSFGKIIPDRAYYHEWSTAEGNYNNHLFSVYLDALSLADTICDEGLTNERFYQSLGGLTTSFGKLYDELQNESFREASLVAVNLGLRGEPEERTRKILLFYKEKLFQSTDFQRSIEESISKLKEAIILTEDEMDKSWTTRSLIASNTLDFGKMIEKAKRLDRKDERKY